MLPVAGPVRSPFDPARLHPITRVIAPHTGVDFGVPIGTPVVTPLPGIVSVTGYDPPRAEGGTGAGRYLRLYHGVIGGAEITTRYYHLSKVLVLGRVTAGQTVALSGNTGDSTGPHLHFEVRVNGVPVNPLPWLAAHDAAQPTPAPEEDDVLNDQDKTWIHDEILRCIRAEVGPLVMAAAVVPETGDLRATVLGTRRIADEIRDAVKSLTPQAGGAPVDVDALAEAVAAKLAARLAS